MRIISKLTAQNEIKNGQLAGLSVSEMKLARQLHIVYRRNGILSQAAKSFLQLAKEFK